MITSIYASLIALIFVALSANVVRGRGAHKLSLGDGGHDDMIRVVRAQANCAEYAPIALLMILLLDLQTQTGWLVHMCGLLILVGRALHAYGLTFPSSTVNIFRLIGMVMTLLSIIIASVANLVVALVF